MKRSSVILSVSVDTLELPPLKLFPCLKWQRIKVEQNFPEIFVTSVLFKLSHLHQKIFSLKSYSFTILLFQKLASQVLNKVTCQGKFRHIV